jgi:hypothetical protein
MLAMAAMDDLCREDPDKPRFKNQDIPRLILKNWGSLGQTIQVLVDKLTNYTKGTSFFCLSLFVNVPLYSC